MTSVVVGTEGGAALKCNLAPATKVIREQPPTNQTAMGLFIRRLHCRRLIMAIYRPILLVKHTQHLHIQSFRPFVDKGRC